MKKNNFILLINSPYSLVEYGASREPLGLSYLASSLLEAGFKVSIIDYDVKEYDPKKLRKIIRDKKPLFIGFGCTSRSYSSAKKIIKDIQTNFPIILGGPHVYLTDMAEEVLRDTGVDIVTRGESELTIIEIAKLLQESGVSNKLRNIDGISYSLGGEIYHNKYREVNMHLDKIPFPARKLLPMDKYGFYEKKRTVAVLSSRGCPYSCIYCYNSKIKNKKVRFRSVDNVMEELEKIKRQFPDRIIYFNDDNLTSHKKRILELCSRLKGKGIKWICSARADNVDEERLEAMKQAGCLIISYGFESGDQESLDKMNKRCTLEQIKKAVALTKRVGIKVYANFMIGFPWEDSASVRRTIKFAKSLNLDRYYFWIVTPFPNSKLWDMAIEQKLIKTPIDWSMFSQKNNLFKVKLDPEFLNWAVEYADLYCNFNKVYSESINPSSWIKFIFKLYNPLSAIKNSFPLTHSYWYKIFYGPYRTNGFRDKTLKQKISYILKFWIGSPVNLDLHSILMNFNIIIGMTLASLNDLLKSVIS